MEAFRALPSVDRLLGAPAGAALVAAHGRQAWMDQVTQLATTLYPRLLRPAGERFAPASGQGAASFLSSSICSS